MSQEKEMQVAETVNENTTEITKNESETPKTDRFSELSRIRMGAFNVKISYNDLKYIKNLLNGKIEWRGPNESYLLIISFLAIDGALSNLDQKSGNTPVNVELPSAAIESISHFLTRVTGKGLESAQRLFAVSMLLRPAMEEIRKVDAEIETLKNEMNSKKSDMKSDK